MSQDSRPVLLDSETLVSFLDRMDAWKAQGAWVPAANGDEEPFTTRSGRRLLYCFQPRSGKHAYLDMGTDIILSDDEARLYLGDGV